MNLYSECSVWLCDDYASANSKTKTDTVWWTEHFKAKGTDISLKIQNQSKKSVNIGLKLQ